jgi:5-methyltetrahydropteroyltriglutamate--homocysteine methyltransferase
MEDGLAVDRKAYDACLAASVVEVIRKQKEAGIDVVSDGEFGKFRSWSFYVLDRIAGFEEREVTEIKGIGKDASLFPEFYAEYFPSQNLPKRGIVACTGPIRYTGQKAVRKDIKVFRTALKSAPSDGAFMPVVAPASAVPRFQNEYYKDDDEMMFAMADAMHEEYAAIVKAGFTVQVDDAFLPYMFDMAFASEDLEEYLKWASMRIDALNHALRGIDEEHIRYHICWGSFNTPHVGDVPLKDIVELVLRVNAGAYCIEMGNPRHAHEWKVFEDTRLPEGKTLIPGVISHSTNVVEHPELVAERLVRLANLVGRDNIMAGTDCGFAQGPFVQRVHPTIQWAKLEALAEGAKIASDTLWN